MATTVTETIGTAGGRDYSTIGGWEAATDNDLVTADEVRVGECYNDSVFDELVVIDGATTDSTRFRHLTVAEGERHSATPGTGARIITTDKSSRHIDQNEPYSKLKWLAFSDTGTAGGSYSVYLPPGTIGCETGHLFIYDMPDLANGLQAFSTTVISSLAEAPLIHNCIALNAGSCGLDVVGNGRLHNCVSWGHTSQNIEQDDNGVAGYMEFRNNWAGDGGSPTNGDFRWRRTDSLVQFFTSNNATSDATANDKGGAGHLTSVDETSQFVSTSPGSEDFHLQAGADLIDAGTDLGDVPAKIDIDGGDRHAAGVTWDIGADERELAGSTPVSTTSEGLFEALEGILQTSAGLQEAKGLLAVSSAGLHEAKGTQRVASVSLHESLQGGVVASSNGLLEAVGSVAATSTGLHEAKGRLVVTSTGLMEFLAAPVVDLSSFLFYWSGETNKRPVVGGDPLYTRDSVRWYLDPNTEKFRRVPAHYSPVSEERSFSGYDVPVLHLERAGIAENQDTNRFDSGSAWSVDTFAAVSPVGAVFEGEHGYLFRASNTSQATRQVVGTFTGSPETLSAIVEVVRRPGSGKVSLQLYDTDGSTVVARADLDVDDGTVTAVTGEAELVRAWSRKGPNGGDVFRFTARGSGTNGNARRIEVFPTGPGTGSDSGSVVVHHAQLEEQGWTSSPIVSEAAGATRATTDLFYVGGAPTVDSKVVIYGRVWKDFDADGPGSEPALLTIGDPTGVRLVVYWAAGVGFQLVNSSTNVAKTLSPVGDAGDEVEFYWALEPDWRGRVGLRVDGGTPSGADHDPIAPEDWGENRIYLNRRTSTKKGAARFESVKAYLAGDVRAALDGTEDEDLFDELREHRLDRRGSLYLLR